MKFFSTIFALSLFIHISCSPVQNFKSISEKNSSTTSLGNTSSSSSLPATTNNHLPTPVPTPAPVPAPAPAPTPTPAPAPAPSSNIKYCTLPNSTSQVQGGNSFSYYSISSGSDMDCINNKKITLCDAATGLFNPAINVTQYFINCTVTSSATTVPLVVPDPGKFINLALDTPWDHDPVKPPVLSAVSGVEGYAKGMNKLWSGKIFNPYYGASGAFFQVFGGHFGYNGTEVTGFSLDSRKWFTLGTTYPYATDAPDLNFSLLPLQAQLDYDSYWFDWKYNYPANAVATTDQDYPSTCPIASLTCEDIPVSVHNYQGADIVPPSVAGNTNGWLLLKQYGKTTIHKFDFDKRIWRRFQTALIDEPNGTNGAENFPYIVFDSRRNRVWSVQPYYVFAYFDIINQKAQKWNVVRYADSESTIWTPNLVRSTASFAFIKRDRAEDDVLLVLENPADYNAELWIIYDLDGKLGTVGNGLGKPKWKKVLTNTNGGLRTEGSLSYVSSLNKIYNYRNGDGTNVTTIIPPASGDWVSGTWTFSKETFVAQESGTIPGYYYSEGGTALWQAFFWVDKWKTFMWSGEPGTQSQTPRNQSVQLWSPH